MSPIRTTCTSSAALVGPGMKEPKLLLAGTDYLSKK